MPLRRALPLFVVWASAAVPACAFVTSGLGPGSTGNSGGAGSTSTTTGTSGTCPSSTCAAIPEGWTLARARIADPAAPDASAPDAAAPDATAPDASAPSCADGSAAAVYVHGPSTPACAPCVCGQPMDASCSAPQITCSYSTLDCSTNDLQLQEGSSGCSTHIPGVLFGNSNGSCRLTAPGNLATPGTCDASGSAPSPQGAWQGTVVVCAAAATGDGCAAAESCLPAGTTADGALCITRADTTPCPAGWTAQITTAYEGGADTRSCSACACDVGCTGGSYVVYTQDLCIDGTKVTVDSASCTQAPGIFDWSTASVDATVAAPALAGCSGGVASGAVTPSGPHMICCR